MRAWAVYRTLVGARVRAQWQYRTSFMIDAIGSFVFSAGELVVILILFRHIPSLHDWTLAEVCFLYGTAGVGFATADLLVGHIEGIGAMIRSGTFDTVLIRPAHSLLQVFALDLALRRLGRLLQALIVLGAAIAALDIEWNLARAAMTVVMMLCAAGIFASLFVLLSTFQFWVIGAAEVANAFTYGGSYITRYPLDVLSVWLRRLLMWIVPLAFVAWLPAMYVLGRDDQPRWLQLAPPAVTVLMCAGAVAMWNTGVRHYRSTGS